MAAIVMIVMTVAFFVYAAFALLVTRCALHAPRHPGNENVNRTVAKHRT